MTLEITRGTVWESRQMERYQLFNCSSNITGHGFERRPQEPRAEQAVRAGQLWPFDGPLKDADLMARRKNFQTGAPRGFEAT